MIIYICSFFPPPHPHNTHTHWQHIQQPTRHHMPTLRDHLPHDNTNTIHTLNAHARKRNHPTHTNWIHGHTIANRPPHTHKHPLPANRQPWPTLTHTRTHKRTRDRCHGIGWIRDHQTPGRPLFRGDPGALERGKDMYLYTGTNCRRFDTIVKWKLPKNAQNKKYYV